MLTQTVQHHCVTGLLIGMSAYLMYV